MGTGAAFGNFAGIDKKLVITLSGTPPFTGSNGSMAVNLVDVASGW